MHELDFEWAGFEWIEANDAANSVIAFQRRARNQDNAIIVVCNFTPVVRDDYRVGVPRPGYYREILNTDSAYYWGSGAGNGGGVNAEPYTVERKTVVNQPAPAAARRELF